VLLLDLDDAILDDTGAREECWRVACVEAGVGAAISTVVLRSCRRNTR
jgi:hypothetical protein